MIFRILEGKPRPAKAKDIIDLLVQHADDVVKKSEGLLFLQVLNSGDHDVMAVTSWRSNKDMERYLELEQTKAFYRKLPTLLMGVPSIRTFDVVSTVIGQDALQTEAAQWLRK